MPGRLFVTGTPIGNLSDCAPRVLQTLRDCAVIAAEDTRVTAKLLSHFNIHTPLVSCHAHNERGMAQALVARMLHEEIDVALVTDAGMPAISDPGHLLVQAVAEAGMAVLSVPGPSAVACALSVSGFDTRAFAFYGFLPRPKRALSEKLVEIARGVPIAVVYESPHRVVALMEAVVDTLPGCRVCVCCDLTKLYELSLRGDARTVLAQMRANPNVEKGEYCIVLDFGGVMLPPLPAHPPTPEEALVEALLAGRSMQEAMAEAVARGIKRNAAYQASLRLRSLFERPQAESEALD